jgi:hypothetical protein
MSSRSRSLRYTIPLMIVLPSLAGMTLISGIAAYHTRETSRVLLKDLSVALTQNVEAHLATYVALPPRVNAINAAAIRRGELDPHDISGLAREFWRQGGRYGELGGIRYGETATGALGGMTRLTDQVPLVSLSTADTNYALTRYDVNNQGQPSQVVSQTDKFDSRTRPWYRAAVKAGKPTWNAYIDATTKQIRLAATQPLYRQDSSELLGVLSSDFFTSQISDFLKSLKVGKSGCVYIIDQSGQLVATSSPEPLAKETSQPLVGMPTISAFESREPMVRDTSRFLQKKFGSFHQVQTDQLLRTGVEGKSVFIKTTQFQDPYGLDWTVVLVFSASEFTHGVNDVIWSAIAITSGALFVFAVLGWWLSRGLVKPIEILTQAAQLIEASQALPAQLAIVNRRSDELGQLGQVIAQMATVVQSREQSLAEQLQQVQHQGRLDQVQLRITSGALAPEQVMARSQQVRDRTRSSPTSVDQQLRQALIFADLTYSQRQSLAAIGELQTFSAHHQIVAAGHSSEDFYVILAGQVLVQIGDYPVVSLVPGEYFGAVGLFASVNNASVMATMPTQLMKFDQAAWQTIRQQYPAIQAQIATTLTQRQEAIQQIQTDLAAQQKSSWRDAFGWLKRMPQLFGSR